MDYEIYGGMLPAIQFNLNIGENIYTQSGGMVWMNDGIEMQTNMKGGFMKGLGRIFSGESLFMATYKAITSNASITMASSFPGEILTLDLSGNTEYVIQKSAFLCATSDVELSAELVKNLGGGFFGGEGFILQRLKGNGSAFLEIDGSSKSYNLAPGEKLKVDTGNVAAYESTVTYSAEMVKGFANILFGGEGLFLTTLTGPGRVWLQTMTSSEFASKIIPFLPQSK